MKSTEKIKTKHCGMLGILLAASALLPNSINAKNVYIDPQIKNFPSVKSQNEAVIQLFSHGRPGALFLDGKWRDADEIVSFIKEHRLISSHSKSLNIYGCEFAKGTKGLKALTTIEKKLGIPVAASNNITGKHGDWNLEEGKAMDVLQITNYAYDLQTICRDTTYTPINTGWSAPPASPSYNPPTSCNNNTGFTSNGTGASSFYNWGFNTSYDSPNGYNWTRTLSGLDPAKKYRVRVVMQSYTNSLDLRNGYFNNYNLAGQTGSFVAIGGTTIQNQNNLNFIVTNQALLSFSGTIQGAPWNGCDQAVNFYVQIYVDELGITTTYTSPTATADTAYNVCPASTTNLTGMAMGCGTGSTVQWHTTNMGYSNSTQVPDITNVANGTYYAVCYNATKGCYSPASSAVRVNNIICTSLPIDFKNNNAAWKNNDVLINWTVANEENSNYFSIECSFNGKDFNEIAQVKSIGNHKDDYDYSFTDREVKPQTTDKVFYRVKQMDMEGNNNTTNIMMLSIADLKEVAYVYPNPIAADNFNFAYQNNSIQNTSINIQLTDAYGKIVYQTEKAIVNGKNIIPVSTNRLHAGMYFLQYLSKDGLTKGVIRVLKK